MTQDEFVKRHNEILEALPIEFRGPVSFKAYQDGHSAGYEEILIHMEELVDMLREPIAKFVVRQLSED